MSVVLETTLGDLTVDLLTQERPRTCLNFLKLCKIKYYNFCLFHKIQRNFMAQTGDPTDTGRGGESIFARLYGEQAKYFEAETKPKIKHVNIGTLSMVNNGSDLLGSQFFLTLGENLDYIDDRHCVFGEVVEGLEVLMKINDAICDENHKPYQDIRITHTVILEDPYEDPSTLAIPDRSPEPTAEQLNSGRIAADEEIDDTKGKTLDQIEEEIQDKEAKARATILEMVGDIPTVDVRPPDNVLFVCKLNPVTTAEDLEVIFSRFGKIVSCEVIKDKQSNESLQYAFIEFEAEKDCENAYFKMDNVLIDDRRIHVDFSQSVAKFKWQENLQERLQQKQKDNLILKEKAGKRQDKKYDMVFDDVQLETKAKRGSHRSERSDREKDRRREPNRADKRRESPPRRYRRSHSRSPDRRQDFRQQPRFYQQRNYQRPYHNDRRNFQQNRSFVPYRDTSQHQKYQRVQSHSSYARETERKSSRKRRSRSSSSSAGSDSRKRQLQRSSSSPDSNAGTSRKSRKKSRSSSKELPRTYAKDKRRRSPSSETRDTRQRRYVPPVHEKYRSRERRSRSSS